MTIIYINGLALDLFPETSVAITIQKINVAQLSTRYLSRTNQFTIPRTQRNETIFEMAGSLSVVSSIPYSLQSAKVVQNGIEVIQNAKAKIISATRKDYTIQILENLVDVFTNIRGKYISDLNPISASAWDAAGIDAARTATSGTISAVMWWGKSGALYQSNYFLPCFFYSTIINKILQATGLNISGNVLSSTDYTDLVIPYPNDSFVYNQGLVQGFYDVGSNTSGGIGGSQWALGYNDFFLTGTTGRWSSYYYPLTNPSAVTATFSGSFVFSSIVWSAGTTNGRYWMELMRTRSGSTTSVGTTDGTSNINYANTSGTITASFTGVDVRAGDTFNWRIRATATGGTLTTNSALVSCTNGIVSADVVVNRAMVSWNSLWNQIDCIQLLEDFFNRFAIIPKQVGNTLFLKSIEEIIADTSNAVDWSSKRASNDFIYSESDFENLNQLNLGKGSMIITNAIESVKTIFNSIFQMCETSSDYFFTFDNVAKIPVYGTTSTSISTFENKPSFTILTLRSRTTEQAITFDTTSRTDYKLAHFVDSTKTKDSGFNYFLGKYYKLFQSAIERNKIIVRMYRLNELDIANYDPHLMIYDDGYYIVNKIDNFVPNQLTKVELFKVG
jgi:hypothetical protein